MEKRLITLLALLFCSLLPVQKTSAQSLFDWFNKESIKDVIDDVASNFIDFKIVGTWNYTGSAVKLESSDNVLADLGATAASSSIEGKVNEQLQRVGIKPGSMQFQFLEDQTMLITIGSKKIKGTYTYNKDLGELQMKIADRYPITTKVEVRSSNFSILFNAKGLLSTVKYISGKINISYLEAACSLLENYDDMKIGFDFEEQR